MTKEPSDGYGGVDREGEEDRGIGERGKDIKSRTPRERSA
jgi:hypothetical protein